jgi:hypothetical protein
VRSTRSAGPWLALVMAATHAAICCMGLVVVCCVLREGYGSGCGGGAGNKALRCVRALRAALSRSAHKKLSTARMSLTRAQQDRVRWSSCFEWHLFQPLKRGKRPLDKGGTHLFTGPGAAVWLQLAFAATRAHVKTTSLLLG